MAGLFGSGLGLGFNQGLGQSVGKSVGENGLDEGTATSLALLNAMRQQQEAGLQRTATPIGSIAQNLIPLFGALIMGKAMSQQAAAGNDLESQKTMSEIAKNNAEATRAGSDAARIKSETEWREKLRKDPQGALAGLLGATGGGTDSMAAQGMKPSFTVNPETGTASMRLSSDVKTPAAMDQARELAGIQANKQLNVGTQLAQVHEDTAKQLIDYKRSLPPPMSEKTAEVLSAGEALKQSLNNAEDAINSIPKDMSREDLAANISNFKWRADHPDIAMGMQRAGVYDFPTDPRLSKYLNWLGMTQSALAKYNVGGRVGGFKLVQYLNPHFPGWADDPRDGALQKAKMIRADKSSMMTQIDEFAKRMTTAADTAGEHGGQEVGGWVQKTARNAKTGQTRTIFWNPNTGEVSEQAPAE